MKIQINTDPEFCETEVIVNCNCLSPEVEKIINTLRIIDMKLTGTSGGQTYILDPASVFYIDTVDKKTFIYSDTEVFETPLKLYELEQQLTEHDFLRIGKSCLVNFQKIKSLKAEIDGRIQLTLENEERLIASRQYANSIKAKLGAKI